MRKLLLAISFVFAISVIGSAQATRSRTVVDAGNNTSAQKQNGRFDLQSETQLAAQLEGALDARHAKAGDRVVLKTVQAVKQNGQTVVPKGAKLLGHVTDVQQQTKSTGESHIGVVFNSLRSGSAETPITATILSITQARAQSGNAEIESEAMSQSTMNSRSSAGTSRGGGGVLGGVGNTVGGVLNTTTNTTGNVIGSAQNAAGSTVGRTSRTAGNLTGSLRGLQISESGGVTADGGSTLSLSGRNLRLESGTTFNLSVRQSMAAGTAP